MDEEIAFLGGLTAGMTHEVSNVLATIRESAGLLQDLMDADRSFPDASRDRFRKKLDQVLAQVARGVELMRIHNRLAHSMDDSGSAHNVGEVLHLICDLMQHSIRRRNARLEVSTCAPGVEVRTDLFRLLMVLKACIDCCLDHAGSGETVRLECREDDDHVTIGITVGRTEASPPGESARTADLRALEPVLARLNAGLQIEGEDCRLGLQLSLPCSDD